MQSIIQQVMGGEPVDKIKVYQEVWANFRRVLVEKDAQRLAKLNKEDKSNE